MRLFLLGAIAFLCLPLTACLESATPVAPSSKQTGLTGVNQVPNTGASQATHQGVVNATGQNFEVRHYDLPGPVVVETPPTAH